MEFFQRGGGSCLNENFLRTILFCLCLDIFSETIIYDYQELHLLFSGNLYFCFYCLLFTVYCLLHTVYCSLFTVYSSIFTVYYLLFTVYVVLFAVQPWSYWEIDQSSKSNFVSLFFQNCRIFGRCFRLQFTRICSKKIYINLKYQEKIGIR